MEDKVIEVPDEPSRTGHSDKTGKDWSIYKVVTESGKTASVFAPVKEGDIVILKHDEKYGYQGQVKRDKPATKVDFSEVLDPLRRLYLLNQDIIKKQAYLESKLDRLIELGGLIGDRSKSEEIDNTNIERDWENLGRSK